MTVNSITDAKAHLSSLIEQVLPGALAGRITIAPDFDELPGDLAQTFGMEG